MKITADIICDSINLDGDRLTTFVLEYPRFIHSQMMTHRTFCLDGDSVLEFDLPGGAKRYDKHVFKMTIRDFVTKWHFGDSRGRLMRDRLKGMRIRQLDERTMMIRHSSVVDCVFSGVKEVFEVATKSRRVRGSKDHLVLTTSGWKRIEDLIPGLDKVVTEKYGKMSADKIDSNRLKKIDGRWVQQFNRNIKQEKIAEQENKCAKCGNDISEYGEIRHVAPIHQRLDLAFEKSNVVVLCYECHKGQHECQGWQGGMYLYGNEETVISVTSQGTTDTYDLEIAGEFANFIANGVVVHNSRNSSSSRAIPVERMIESVINDQVEPVFWGKNQRGMVAEKELSGKEVNIAKNLWNNARENAIATARELAAIGAHKQIVNRVLEPFMMIRVILSGTDFDNFFELRIAHDAQPEIQAVAIKMKAAMDNNEPKQLEYYTDVHAPFLSPEEYSGLQPHERNVVSVARCARVSYKSYETGEISNLEQDTVLYERLKREGHMSPFEHVAFPVTGGVRYANFVGWQQLRYWLEVKH